MIVNYNFKSCPHSFEVDSPTHSLFVALCPSLYLYVSLPLSFCLSSCVSVYHLSVCLFFSLPNSVFIFVCLSVSLFVSFSYCLFFSGSVSISLFVSLYLHHYLCSLFLLYLSQRLSVFAYLSLFLFISMSVCVCLSLFLYTAVCPFCPHHYLSVSLKIFFSCLTISLS